MNRQFPRLEISRSRLRHNMEEVISRCTAQGIQVCGVIKGCSGLPEVGQLFRDCGATQLASSRLEQIIRCRQAGVPGPYMLLRIPMLCELDDVARWCDYSLESERATLDALEEACARQGAVHKAVIMADLGDLREGFWDQDEMLDVCVHVERDLPHVELAGVGVNLGCYGSIQPTPASSAESTSTHTRYPPTASTGLRRRRRRWRYVCGWFSSLWAAASRTCRVSQLAVSSFR